MNTVRRLARRLSPHRRPLALLALLVGSLGAEAGPTVGVEWQGISPSLSVEYFWNSNESDVTHAGIFNFQTVHPLLGTEDLGNFMAFCIELGQGLPNVGKNILYKVVDLENASWPGQDIGGEGVHGPMGAAKANLLRELWGEHFSALFDEVQAAAFQIAVWEIVHDDGLALDDGRFRVGKPGGSAETLAQAWLSSLNGTGKMAQLIGLSNRKYQDMVTMAHAPEPAALALWGICASALVYWRRKGS